MISKVGIKVYKSYDIFPVFLSRLPDKRRKYVKEISPKSILVSVGQTTVANLFL